MITWQYIDKWTDKHDIITSLIFMVISYLICLLIPSIFMLIVILLMHIEYTYNELFYIIFTIGTFIYLILLIYILCKAGNNFN